MQDIVSSDWLSAHLHGADLLVLDASHLAVGGQKPPHEGIHIPGARKFNIDAFSKQATDLPHMLAPAPFFEQRARALGINRNSHLVLYDNLGVYSSPRAWWMRKVMGHSKVSVLDGGLPKWVAEGRPVEETNERHLPPGDFKASLDPAMVKSMHQVRSNIARPRFQVIDARSRGRFEGTAPEPRPQLASGHLPGSMNIPYEEVLENGCFKSADRLTELFKHLPAGQELTFSCGSGLTACIVMLAAKQVVKNELSLYDGSWTEWASEKGNVR